MGTYLILLEQMVAVTSKLFSYGHQLGLYKENRNHSDYLKLLSLQKTAKVYCIAQDIIPKIL